MQILGLLGMSIDVVEFQTFLLLFRLALAILCYAVSKNLVELLPKYNCLLLAN